MTIRKRAKSKVKQQTPGEYQAAIRKVTRDFGAAVTISKELLQGIQGSKRLTDALVDTAPDIEENQHFKSAIAKLVELQTLSSTVVSTIQETKALLEEPPQYYPYSTDRLDSWVMDIYQILAVNLTGQIEKLSTDLVAVQLDIDTATSEMEAAGTTINIEEDKETGDE